MKRVLLTGATGLVGQFAARALVEGGFEVHAISSRPAAADDRFSPAIIWHQLDLLSESAAGLIAAIAPTHLLHCAWYVKPERLYTSLENYRWVQASLALLQEFQEGGGNRAVMLGSCAEYDWTDGLCIEGTTPTIPTSPYGVCKLALGQLAGSFAGQTNLSFAWARVFFLYGPNEHSNRLVASVVSSLLKGELANCSSGEQKRDLLHAQDAAEACVALLDSDVEGVVNIASGAPVPVKEVIHEIANQLDRPELLRMGTRSAAHEPPLVYADISRLSEEVGWIPRYDLESGLRDTINSWRQKLAGSSG